MPSLPSNTLIPPADAPKPEPRKATPEQVQAAKRVLAQHLREQIIAGNEPALWEYIALQWPAAVLDEFQKDIIRSGMLGGVKRIAIKGCTSPGKGFAVSLLANIWFDVHPECKVILTSSNIEHAEKVIFGEVVSLRRRMLYSIEAKVMTRQIKGLDKEGNLDSKHYLITANPKTGEGFSGQHGPKTLFVFDESSAVPDHLYENAMQQAVLIVALSNPRVRSGWFFDLFKPAGEDKIDETQTVMTTTGPTRLITVGGPDCRNVREKRLKEPFAPPGGIIIKNQKFEEGQRIPHELFLEVKTVVPNQMDYAAYIATMSNADPMWRDVFGLGKFPKEDADSQLFLPSWFPRHHGAWNDQIPVEAFGLDLAATARDGDETVLAAGGSAGCRCLHPWKKGDTTKTVSEVLRVSADDYGIDLTEGRHPVAIDMTGIGKAVHDMLAEKGVLCVPVWGNGSPQVNRELYDNRRAEVYGELSSRMDPEKCPETPWPIPLDRMLEQELCAHDKIPKLRGFGVTPKSRFKGMTYQGHTVQEKIGRSPDRSDSVAYLYAAVRSLDSGVGAATLDRPLILLTEAERIEADAAEAAKRQAEAPKSHWETVSDEHSALIGGFSDEIEREYGELSQVPYPDFL